MKKPGLKLNIQKTKIMASVPSLHGKQMVKTVEIVTDFVFSVSKITEGFMTTAMKLKDACSLEEKL